MKRKLYFAAFAAAALTACNEHVIELSDESVGKVELGVTLPAAMTKVSGASSENDVNDLQIFVFDDSGSLEAYGHTASTSLTLNCFPGSKTVVALVNAPALSNVTSYSELTATSSALSDNAVSSLVMEGEVPVDLKASTSVTVPVERIVAKVTLTKIVNALELDYHRKMTFAVTSVYLINVAGDKLYLTDSEPKDWFNKMKYVSGSLSFLWQSLGDEVISNDATYSTPHYFYCYPNHTETGHNDGVWEPRFTRLVVQATLGGETYYYPVTLPRVDQNTAYDISLTVTRPGSDSPDKPVDTQAAEFKIQVVDWADGGDINEVI